MPSYSFTLSKKLFLCSCMCAYMHTYMCVHVQLAYMCVIVCVWMTETNQWELVLSSVGLREGTQAIPSTLICQLKIGKHIAIAITNNMHLKRLMIHINFLMENQGEGATKYQSEKGDLYQFHVVTCRFPVWNSVQRFLHLGNIFLLWLCLMWVFCSAAFIPHWKIKKIILKSLV